MGSSTGRARRGLRAVPLVTYDHASGGKVLVGEVLPEGDQRALDGEAGLQREHAACELGALAESLPQRLVSGEELAVRGNLLPHELWEVVVGRELTEEELQHAEVTQLLAAG